MKVIDLIICNDNWKWDDTLCICRDWESKPFDKLLAVAAMTKYAKYEVTHFEGNTIYIDE